MAYFINKEIKNSGFDEVIDQVTEELKKEGFGVLTDIDIQSTFKKKLDVDFRKYRILGACNPNFAHQALSNEDKIGVFLPCNVIVQELENGSIEVAAVDPIASMISVENDQLPILAQEVKDKLTRVIESL
ncbi:MAG: DUF302 domain-containing protein [Crocinitomicaceae bacterium]|nr:DUF302 domain-containing protein [Crocinitomicaceae bacterium]